LKSKPAEKETGCNFVVKKMENFLLPGWTRPRTKETLLFGQSDCRGPTCGFENYSRGGRGKVAPRAGRTEGIVGGGKKAEVVKNQLSRDGGRLKRAESRGRRGEPKAKKSTKKGGREKEIKGGILQGARRVSMKRKDKRHGNGAVKDRGTHQNST